MQNVVVDKPYRFVPPYQGRFLARWLQRFVRIRLRREFGITSVECRGLDRLAQSRAAGHGILLAPNHCRPCDPFVVSELGRQAGLLPFTLASAHLFMQNRLQSWILRRAGVFSIYREGPDRAALNAAVDILAVGDRPLILFPEGVINRTNDRLSPLMEGAALIARTAAKKRAAAAPPSQVVVHPVALRYQFGGDIVAAVTPVLAELEHRLSWRPQTELPLPERIRKVGEALLGLKEIEYLGTSQSGPVFERLERLIDQVLLPLEQEWVPGKAASGVVARVKKLRAAILPEMIDGEITQAERERRWRHLADVYLAQQMSYYPPDYIRSNPSPDRILETVERFEEDLTDVCRRYAPMKAIATVGEAIVVSPARERGAAEDPLMAGLDAQLRQLLDIEPAAEAGAAS